MININDYIIEKLKLHSDSIKDNIHNEILDEILEISQLVNNKESEETINDWIKTYEVKLVNFYILKSMDINKHPMYKKLQANENSFIEGFSKFLTV